MTDRAELARRLGEVARSQTNDLSSLVELVGLDPACDFRTVNLAGVDVRGQDLRAFDFSQASFRGALIAGAKFNQTVSEGQKREARDAAAVLRMAEAERRKLTRAAFAELATVEAWLGSSSEETGKASLFVNVNFGTARIASASKPGVRFRLSLQRAEVVVIVPEKEPVQIDPASVWRAYDPEVREASVERTRRSSSTSGAKTSLDGTKLSLSAEAATSSASKLVTTTYFPRVANSKAADGGYRWLVSDDISPLQGRPWDASRRPLLDLVDTRAVRGRQVPPMAIVEVRCLREDLKITDIRLEDESLWKRRIGGARNRMIAAETAIRSILLDSGLSEAEFEHGFSPVTLARATVSFDL